MEKCQCLIGTGEGVADSLQFRHQQICVGDGVSGKLCNTVTGILRRNGFMQGRLPVPVLIGITVIVE